MGRTFIGWRVWAQCRIQDGLLREVPPVPVARTDLLDAPGLVKSTWISPSLDSRSVNTLPPMLTLPRLVSSAAIHCHIA
jgi:hypothetical protein